MFSQFTQIVLLLCVKTRKIKIKQKYSYMLLLIGLVFGKKKINLGRWHFGWIDAVLNEVRRLDYKRRKYRRESLW